MNFVITENKGFLVGAARLIPGMLTIGVINHFLKSSNACQVLLGFETINKFQENDLFSLVYLRSCVPFEPLSSWLAFVSNNNSQVG